MLAAISLSSCVEHKGEWKLRTIDAAQEAVYSSDAKSYHVKISIKNSTGAWVDWSNYEGYDWIESWEVAENVDSLLKTARVILFRKIEYFNISPLFEASKPQQLTGSYAPIITVNRDLKIEVATLGESVKPAAAQYNQIFYGVIDSIDPGGSNNQITISCRDQAGDLQDNFIEAQGVYGDPAGSPVETEIQAVLTDNGTGVTLYTPVSPSWNVKEFIVQKEPVLTAIKRLADQIGWELRFKWRAGTSQYELTLYAPDRAASTALRTFGPDDYSNITNARIGRENVRNVLKLYYTDQNGDSQSVTVTSAASIAKYGRRYMEITEASTSNIDTNGEATTMANAIINDLKEPSMSHVVEMPFFWQVELGDLYAFTNNKETYDTTQKLAVYGYRHAGTRDSVRTTLTCQGQPSGGFRKWLHKGARPGGPSIKDEFGLVAIKPGFDFANATTNFQKLGIGTQNLNTQTDRFSQVPNSDFGAQSRAVAGSGWLPDNWDMVSSYGSWSASGDVWYSTTVQKSGARSIHFRNTATADTRIENNLFPVTEGDLYVFAAQVYGDSADASDAHLITVSWYQQDRSTLVSTQNIYNSRATGSAWIKTDPVYYVAPSGAKWAKITIKKTTSTAHNFYVDRIMANRAMDGFRVYATAGQSVSDVSVAVIQWGTEDFDYSGGFDLANDIFKCVYGGLYLFALQCTFPVMVDQAAMILSLQKSTNSGSTWNTISQGVTSASGGSPPMSGSFTDQVILNAGDWVRARIYQQSGGARTISTNSYETFFAGNQLTTIF